MELRRSCKFVLPKEMSPFFLWIGKNIRERIVSANFVDQNDKQNVMETFSDKMLGTIGKKLMSKVTHFLIFKVWNKELSPTKEKLLLQIPFFQKNGISESNFFSIETFRYLNVKFSVYRYHDGIFQINFICVETTMVSFKSILFVQRPRWYLSFTIWLSFYQKFRSWRMRSLPCSSRLSMTKSQISRFLFSASSDNRRRVFSPTGKSDCTISAIMSSLSFAT